MSPSRLIDAWSGRETISDCCTLTVHQQLRQISCSFQGAWERRSGAEDGTSHFYGLSSLISAWKGWFGWGGENFVLTLCRICLLCPMSSHMAAAKLSLGQGGEHATAPPLGVKHVLQENQGSNSTKKHPDGPVCCWQIFMQGWKPESICLLCSWSPREPTPWSHSQQALYSH